MSFSLPSLARPLVEDGLYSALVLGLGGDRRLAEAAVAGWARRRPPVAVTIKTRFDLASLTKPFTATLALALDRRGRLPLTTVVGELWPRAEAGLARRTLEELLRHRGGLVPWTPLYARCRDRSEALELLLSGQLGGAEPGTYSDLGYILWGWAAEVATGKPLAMLFAEEITAPLGLAGVEASSMEAAGDGIEAIPAQASGAGEVASLAETAGGGDVASQVGASGAGDVAACEIDTAREVELAAEQGLSIEALTAPAPGQVQDGNARFLGGLAGHAGLFASAEALYGLAREWLVPGRLLTPEQVAHALAGDGPYALGWQRRAADGVAAALSPSAYGHLGFTGGSLWIDPTHRRIHLLLGHRTSPTSDLTEARRRLLALTKG